MLTNISSYQPRLVTNYVTFYYMKEYSTNTASLINKNFLTRTRSPFPLYLYKPPPFSEELRAGLFQGYDDDWDSDFDDQPDQDASRMPPPAAPGGAGGGGGMLSIPKNSTQSGSSGDVRLVSGNMQGGAEKG